MHLFPTQRINGHRDKLCSHYGAMYSVKGQISTKITVKTYGKHQNTSHYKAKPPRPYKASLWCNFMNFSWKEPCKRELTARSRLWEFLWAISAALCCCTEPPSPRRYTGKDKEGKASSCFHRYLHRGRNRALGNQFYSPMLCAWKITAYEGPGGTPWNPWGPSRDFKVDPMLWINPPSYRLFRQHEQQFKNWIAIFLNKYFLLRSINFSVILEIALTSVTWIPNPSPLPPNALAEMENSTRTLPLNSSRQIISTIYSALTRFFFNSAFRCYF